MKITFDWLKDHLKTNLKEKNLLEQLTSIGLEVESVESLSFENWALGQPNNFGNDQNFVSISYPNFKWGDWSGDTLGEVICQQEIKGKNERLTEWSIR